MAWQFSEATDQLVGDGWPGTVFTLSMWWYMDTDPDESQDPWAVYSDAGGAGSLRALLGTLGDGTTMRAFDAAFLEQAAGAPGTATWYHTTLVANGTAWTVYHGTNPAALTVVGPDTRTAVNAPGSLLLSLAVEWFRGRLAAIKHWTRALPDTEVAAEAATYNVLNATGLHRLHTCRTTSLANEGGDGSALTAGATPITLVAGPSFLLLTAHAGRPSSAEVARPMTATKIVTLGRPVDVEAARPLAPTKIITLGRPSTTEAPDTLAVVETVQLGRPITVEVARSVSTITLGRPSSAEVARPMTATKIVTLGRPVDVVQARQLAVAEHLTLGRPAEHGAARAAAAVRRAELGRPSTTEAPDPLTPTKIIPLGRATTTEAPDPLIPTKIITLGRPADVGRARQLAPAKHAGLGRPVEVSMVDELLPGVPLGRPAVASAARPLSWRLVPTRPLRGGRPRWTGRPLRAGAPFPAGQPTPPT